VRYSIFSQKRTEPEIHPENYPKALALLYCYGSSKLVKKETRGRKKSVAKKK
jgi:hypothetical protein